MAGLIAIDPGSEHNGIAVFVDGECVGAWEKSPTELFDWLGVCAVLYGGFDNKIDTLVCEEFKLYPDKMASLAWSTLGTVEVIGVLRERCRREKVEFVTQPAAIKNPTMAKAKRLGMKAPRGGHVTDAWAHGLFYLWKQGSA